MWLTYRILTDLHRQRGHKYFVVSQFYVKTVSIFRTFKSTTNKSEKYTDNDYICWTCKSSIIYVFQLFLKQKQHLFSISLLFIQLNLFNVYIYIRIVEKSKNLLKNSILLINNLICKILESKAFLYLFYSEKASMLGMSCKLLVN